MTYDEFMLKSDAERRIIFDQMREVIDRDSTIKLDIDPQQVRQDYERRHQLNDSRDDADW